MKSVRINAPWQVRLEETEMPQPKEKEALIKVVAAGICGSDIGAFRGSNPLVSYPRTIGHELAGEVVSAPENDAGIKPGDRVIVDPYLYCGKCYPCSLGRTNCCEQLRVLGVHVDGGMSEYFAHPVSMLLKVPEDMPWEVIPIAEPLTIALHGLHRARLTRGEHIAINGAGTIGLLAAMCALHYGAVPIVIDPIKARLEKARELGVSLTIHLGEENLEQKIREYTNGRMAEVVLEASGANSAIRHTLDIVSYAGRIVLTGWPKSETAIPTGDVTKKEVDIRGGRTSAGEFPEAIQLIYEKKINVKAILTKLVSLEEAADTIVDIEKNPENYLKVNVLINQ